MLRIAVLVLSSRLFCNNDWLFEVVCLGDRGDHSSSRQWLICEENLVWVSYQKPKKNRDSQGKDRPLATLLVVIIGTPLAMAAAYGAFGFAMQLIGILFSVPLLFLAIHLVMFAPWIGLMWLGAYISHLLRRKRNSKRTKQIP